MKAWTRRGRDVLTTIAVAAALVVASPAFADTASEKQADALFADGRQFLAEKRYSDARAKFEESQRLFPRAGTLLNIGVCEEQDGRLAEAWRAYSRGFEQARRERRADKEKAARDLLDKVEPRLAWITVTIAATARIEGLSVQVDGAPLDTSSWGAATGVTPGKHKVVASAPGFAPYETTVALRAAGDRTTVTIPDLLAPAPAAGSPPEPGTASTPPAAPRTGSTPGANAPPSHAAERGGGGTGRTVAAIVGGTGLGISLATGAWALAKKSTVRDAGCSGNTCPDQASLDTAATARTLETVSTVSFVVGAAGVAAWLLWPTPSTTPDVTAGRDGVRLGLKGRF